MGLGIFLWFYFDSFELLKWQKKSCRQKSVKVIHWFCFSRRQSHHIGICRMLTWVRKTEFQQSPLPPPNPQNKSRRHMNPVISNSFLWFQPTSVWVKSPQARFADHHKQDSSLPAPTSDYKVITFLPWISLQLRIPHTPTLYFQSTFSAHRRSKDSLFTPGATPENFEPTWHLCSLD